MRSHFKIELKTMSQAMTGAIRRWEKNKVGQFWKDDGEGKDRKIGKEEVTKQCIINS